MITSLTAVELRRAASLKERIQSLEKKLAALLGASPPAREEAPARKGKRKTLSAATKARMSAARAKWWAERRAAKKK